MKQYGWGLPLAASSYAGSIDFGIYLIHAVMILIFIIWGVFFTYLLIKYRKKTGVAAQRDEAHGVFKSLIPDLIVMVFEIVLIAVYAIPVWSKIKIDTPASGNVNTVAIEAQQWSWNIHYPGPDGKFGKTESKYVHFSNPIGLDYNDPAAKDDIVIANELHLPVNEPTVIELTSMDVIHSLFIPEFRLKQDAVPGMKIPVWVKPTKIGTFEISCAQLCGMAHSFMRGKVVVQSRADYDAWLKSREPQSAQPVSASEAF